MLALASDFKTYRIKNSITYSFMLIGLTANVTMGGFKGMVFSLQGIVLPAVCLVILYMMRVIGAGDVKLLSAIGAVMGAGFALYTAAYAFLCGGLIAALLILIRRNGVRRFKYLLEYVKGCLLSVSLLEYTDFSDKQEAGRFHFSIAVATGTAVAYIVHGLGLSIL